MAFKGFLFHVEMEQWELLPVDSSVRFTKKELEPDDGPKREQPGVILVAETRYGKQNELDSLEQRNCKGKGKDADVDTERMKDGKGNGKNQAKG